MLYRSMHQGNLALMVIPSGALVIAKQRALQQYAQANLRLRAGPGFSSNTDNGGYAAGYNTGLQQNLGRNVIQ